MAMLALLACSQPDPAELVRNGDLDGARAIATGEWRQHLDAWAALADDRARRHALEYDRSLAGLDGEEPLAAVVTGLDVAFALGRDTEPFDAVGRRLADADPTVHEVLSRAWTHDPERRERHRAAARLGLARQRYAPGAVEQTRASQAGITALMAPRVFERVEAEYVEPPDRAAMDREAAAQLAAVFGVQATGGPERLVEAAVAAGVPVESAVFEIVDGGLGALDPFTAVVWPADLQGWEQHHAGVWVGVGLALRMDGGRVLVDRPLPGSPAFEANVHQDDAVARAGDATDPEGIAASLAGPEGSVLGLDLERDGKPIHVDLQRRTIPVELVTGLRRGAGNRWEHALGDGLYYVRIESFRERTDEELVERVASFDDPRGVVLDLRGNGGGDVDAAVRVADQWVAEGKLAFMEGRGAVDAPADTAVLPWNDATPGHALEGVAVVVLVDRDTASAAELVAGALQGLAGAVVVGERTWGKGLSQGLRLDPMGFALQVTNAAWALPDRRRLDRGGIAPDVAVPLSPVERAWLADVRLRAEALAFHADGSPIEPPAGVDLGDVTPAGDALLQRGVLALRARISTSSAAP